MRYIIQTTIAKMKVLAVVLLTFTFNFDINAQNTITIKVEGSCDMCKDRIEAAALTTIGVIKAEWLVETKMLTVDYDAQLFQESELHLALSKVGHDTEKVKADDAVYHALPSCCAYKTEGHEHHEESEIGHEDDHSVTGIIYELDNQRKKTAIIGATIFWEGTEVFTESKADGSFKLEMNENSHNLIISYTGYSSDTIQVNKPGAIAVVLRSGIELEEIKITGRKRSIEVSYISPIKLRKISQRELTKAACCNLSESFETNPAVDVSFTDAVTGTKQIEMLGLAGSYVQITRENMPDVRGLASIYGLSYIPGPFVESIQLNLGAGSVINGFESIAGQINVEMKKPGDAEKLFVNGYYGSGGRIEGNVIANTPVNDHFDTNIMLHYNTRQQAHDNNFDGFLDMPKGGGFSLLNAWKYYGKKGNEGQFGFKITSSDNTSGQDASHHSGIHPPGYELWQANVKSNRYEAYLKRGKAFLDKPYKSIGFQLGGIYYDQNSLFGKRIYTGDQKMLYANLLYQTIISNTNNKITFGASFQGEQTNEKINETSYERNEYIPGIFGEYTYSKNEKFDVVLGLRADHHNNYGLFFTPRLHTRYALNQSMVLRLSAGRGQRTANIFAENIGAFASSRAFVINGANLNNPYGLDAEVAWNFGLNFTYDVTEKIQWGFDAYSTRFQNQIVVDFDANPQELNFYNLKGKSFSNSIQTQLDWQIFKNFDVRLAYRYNQVKTTFGNDLLQKPLTAPHRAFANAAYEWKGWKFDYTINLQGKKRIPNTASNPENYRLSTESNRFFISNAQITKVFGQKYELYVGGENIFNFMQPRAIISGGEPYSEYFDASLIWGPIFGSMYYAGFRYRLFKED